jgi:hypothetical protein
MATTSLALRQSLETIMLQGIDACAAPLGRFGRRSVVQAAAGEPRVLPLEKTTVGWFKELVARLLPWCCKSAAHRVGVERFGGRLERIFHLLHGIAAEGHCDAASAAQFSEEMNALTKHAYWAERDGTTDFTGLTHAGFLVRFDRFSEEDQSQIAAGMRFLNKYMRDRPDASESHLPDPANDLLKAIAMELEWRCRATAPLGQRMDDWMVDGMMENGGNWDACNRTWDAMLSAADQDLAILSSVQDIKLNDLQAFRYGMLKHAILCQMAMRAPAAFEGGIASVLHAKLTPSQPSSRDALTPLRTPKLIGIKKVASQDLLLNDETQSAGADNPAARQRIASTPRKPRLETSTTNVAVDSSQHSDALSSGGNSPFDSTLQKIFEEEPKPSLRKKSAPKPSLFKDVSLRRADRLEQIKALLQSGDLAIMTIVERTALRRLPLRRLLGLRDGVKPRDVAFPKKLMRFEAKNGLDHDDWNLFVQAMIENEASERIGRHSRLLANAAAILRERHLAMGPLNPNDGESIRRKANDYLDAVRELADAFRDYEDCRTLFPDEPWVREIGKIMPEARTQLAAFEPAISYNDNLWPWLSFQEICDLHADLKTLTPHARLFGESAEAKIVAAALNKCSADIEACSTWRELDLSSEWEKTLAAFRSSIKYMSRPVLQEIKDQCRETIAVMRGELAAVYHHDKQIQLARAQLAMQNELPKQRNKEATQGDNPLGAALTAALATHGAMSSVKMVQNRYFYFSRHLFPNPLRSESIFPGSYAEINEMVGAELQGALEAVKAGDIPPVINGELVAARRRSYLDQLETCLRELNAKIGGQSEEMAQDDARSKVIFARLVQNVPGNSEAVPPSTASRQTEATRELRSTLRLELPGKPEECKPEDLHKPVEILPEELPPKEIMRDWPPAPQASEVSQMQEQEGVDERAANTLYSLDHPLSPTFWNPRPFVGMPGLPPLDDPGREQWAKNLLVAMSVLTRQMAAAAGIDAARGQWPDNSSAFEILTQQFASWMTASYGKASSENIARQYAVLRSLAKYLESLLSDVDPNDAAMHLRLSCPATLLRQITERARDAMVKRHFPVPEQDIPFADWQRNAVADTIGVCANHSTLNVVYGELPQQLERTFLRNRLSAFSQRETVCLREDVQLSELSCKDLGRSGHEISVNNQRILMDRMPSIHEANLERSAQGVVAKQRAMSDVTFDKLNDIVQQLESELGNDDTDMLQAIQSQINQTQGIIMEVGNSALQKNVLPLLRCKDGASIVPTGHSHRFGIAGNAADKAVLKIGQIHPNRVSLAASNWENESLEIRTMYEAALKPEDVDREFASYSMTFRDGGSRVYCSPLSVDCRHFDARTMKNPFDPNNPPDFELVRNPLRK